MHKKITANGKKKTFIINKLKNGSGYEIIRLPKKLASNHKKR
jgi:hypothetical protein